MRASSLFVAILLAGAGPETSSQGSVEVVLPHGESLRALHVRLVVANPNDAAAWSVDASSASLVAGGERSRPMLIASDVTTLPAVIIDRGQQHAIDFYFPPPAAGAQFSCRVTTPHGPLALDVPVAVLAHAAAPHGSQWWADPHYPWPIVRREDGVMGSYLPPSTLRAITIR